MKNLIIVLVLFANACYAAGVSFNLKSVGVVELSEVVIKGALSRDYVISPDVLGNPAKLTMSVTNLEKDKIIPFLTAILKGAGLQLVERAGIFYVEKLPAPSEVAQGVPVQVSPVNSVNSVNPYTGQPFMPGAFGQFGQQQNQLTYYQNGQAPKAVAFHKPRGKSMDFLATVAKLAGAYVPENKGKGDVLVFAGDDETIVRAKKLLEEVDIESQSLSVRAVLLEFTEGDSSSKSLSLALSLLGGKLGVNYAAGSPLSNAISWKGVDLQAALGMIDGDRRFKYLAEPTLRVADGEQARFVVGSEVPVRSSAVKDQGGQAVQSVEYKTAGVVVTVEPKVMKESIRVRVGQQVSSFALTKTSNIDSPTILKREADTVVNVSDGELVILAGMDETTENQSRSGGWGFPALFWGTEKSNARSQLLLMLEVKKVRPPEEI